MMFREKLSDRSSARYQRQRDCWRMLRLPGQVGTVGHITIGDNCVFLAGKQVLLIMYPLIRFMQGFPARTS